MLPSRKLQKRSSRCSRPWRPSAMALGDVDERAAQQGAHRRGVVEVLGADRVVVAAAEEGGATAPVACALPILLGLAALGMDEGFRGQVRHRPGAPIGLSEWSLDRAAAAVPPNT